MNDDPIRRITVVGAGLMGHGIGQQFAQAAYPVTFCDWSEAQLDRARESVRRNLLELTEWKVIERENVEAILGRIQTTTSLEEAVSEADLVIEAVPEDLSLKQRVFRDLDAVCPARTILASNTSSLMPSVLAKSTNRPDRVLVLHFFYPPHLMPLVEIVRGPATSDQTVRVSYDAVVAAGKVPVIAQKEAPGFIANRLQFALFREALHIVEQGIASAQDVDAAVTNSFGRRLAVAGPLETLEVQNGWDVMLNMFSYIQPDLATSSEISPVIREMVARGQLGAKSGRGFYEWTPRRVEEWRARLALALSSYLKKSSASLGEADESLGN